MTEQEVFDAVCAGLAKQDWRLARSRDGACRYRTAEGLGCAVGVLLDDETAAKCDELTDCWCGGVYGVREVLPEMYHEHLALLRDLQIAHDGAQQGDVAELKMRLANTAAAYGLDATAVYQ